MKKVLLLTISLFFITISIAAPDIPDSIKDIKISLKTEKEVNQALEIIKTNSPKVYQSLKKLRKSNPEDFNKKLRNHYYTWLHTQVLIKNMPKKEKGYRQLVKDSEVELKNLQISYQTANQNEKSSLKNKIIQAAQKRYQIELKMKNFQVEQLKVVLEKKQKEVGTFKKHQDIFIERVATKCTREKISK